MTAGTYRFDVGEIRCIAISDGFFEYEAEALFVAAPPDALEETLRESQLRPDAIPLDYTGLFLDTGRNRVLVDTGIGVGVSPSTGALASNLEARGISADEIDTVILTHAHADHIGGSVDPAGEPIFPNARYLMSAPERAFWTAEETLARFDAGNVYGDAHLDGILGSFARNHLLPLGERLEPIEPGELVPGIHAVPAPGHTPGHLALVISSGDASLLHIADTVLHPIHLEHPDWYPFFDLDPGEAASTRSHLLDRAAAETALVAAYHFPFPGLGHVAKRGRAWEWTAAEPEGHT